jgi:hypothetical protein
VPVSTATILDYDSMDAAAAIRSGAAELDLDDAIPISAIRE